MRMWINKYSKLTWMNEKSKLVFPFLIFTLRKYVSFGCLSMSIKCIWESGWGLVSRISLYSKYLHGHHSHLGLMWFLYPSRDAQGTDRIFMQATVWWCESSPNNHQSGAIMSTEACHNCKALYFSNIWEVKESVSRGGSIINKQKRREKRKKRVKKRQQCWRRLGRCARFQTPNLREAAR